MSATVATQEELDELRSRLREVVARRKGLRDHIKSLESRLTTLENPQPKGTAKPGIALETPAAGEVERLTEEVAQLEEGITISRGHRRKWKLESIALTAELEEARGLLERVSIHRGTILNRDIDAYLTRTKPEVKEPTPAVNSNLDPLCSCWDRYGHMDGLDPDCTLHGLIPEPPAPKEAGGLVEAVRDAIAVQSLTDTQARAAIAATADALDEANTVCAAGWLRSQLGDSK